MGGWRACSSLTLPPASRGRCHGVTEGFRRRCVLGMSSHLRTQQEVILAVSVLPGAVQAREVREVNQHRKESSAGGEIEGCSTLQPPPACPAQKALEGCLSWRRVSLSKVIAALSNPRAGSPRQQGARPLCSTAQTRGELLQLPGRHGPCPSPKSTEGCNSFWGAQVGSSEPLTLWVSLMQQS